MMKDMKALDCLKIMSNPKLTKCHQLHVLKTSQNIFPKMISCDFHLIPTKRNRVRGPAGALPGRPVAPRGGNDIVRAADRGLLGAVRHLLRTVPGAAAAKDDWGRRRTALHWAAGEGHGEICRVLLAAGAEVDARTDVSVSALKRWIHGALGDFRVPKKFERNM